MEQNLLLFLLVGILTYFATQTPSMKLSQKNAPIAIYMDIII